MHLRYVFTTCILMSLAAAAPISLDMVSDLPKRSHVERRGISNGGPLGPGLSALIAIAEGILRKYGITQTHADIANKDAELLAIASNIPGRDSPGKVIPEN